MWRFLLDLSNILFLLEAIFHDILAIIFCFLHCVHAVIHYCFIPVSYNVFISFSPSGAQPSYQILAPAYYDQNGQLVMGHNGRGLGTPVRLVSPAPILVNTANGQQGKLNQS